MAVTLPWPSWIATGSGHYSNHRLTSNSMVKDHCQFYAEKKLCPRRATSRLFDGREPLGRVCLDHERFMLKQYPELTAKRIQLAPKIRQAYNGRNLRRLNPHGKNKTRHPQKSNQRR